MAESKAYELPDKKKFPELYKKTGGLFKRKDTTKLSEAIASYARENLTAKDATNLLNFLNGQGHENLSPSQIKYNLTKTCDKGYVREAEFVLALQGKKIEKKDILKVKDIDNRHIKSAYSAICKATENKDGNHLILLGEAMRDAGTPITKNDIMERKSYYKFSFPIDKKHDLKGRVLAIATMNGNLDNVKTIVEMNGEKLGKKDLMLSISHDEIYGSIHSKTNESIAFSALRNNSFDAVEQILTEEGTSLCVNDVLSDFMRGEAFYTPLGKLLASPVFKDSSKNIEEMWEQLPDDYKNSTINQKAYNIAIGKGKVNDLKKEKEDNQSKSEAAAKALNKGNIVAIKSKSGR